jgi:predicted enzyme related to lactoylglutathione lyase
MANPFIHVELNTTDLPKAKAFYKKLFKWKLADVPMDDKQKYTMIDVGKGTGGGMMKQMIPGTGSAWMPYVVVDDIEASTKKAGKIGATVLKGVTEVMGMGWLSVLADPTGAIFGLWKPKRRRR